MVPITSIIDTGLEPEMQNFILEHGCFKLGPFRFDLNQSEFPSLPSCLIGLTKDVTAMRERNPLARCACVGARDAGSQVFDVHRLE